MNRVNRDVTDAEIFVEVPVRGNVPAAILDSHFDLKGSAFADCADVDILVEKLDIGVVFDVSRSVNTGLSPFEIDRFSLFAVQLEWNLLQVENDIGCIFDHARDRRKLVQDAFDLHGSNRSALNGREQNTA